jgi:hypothetical protein
MGIEWTVQAKRYVAGADMTPWLRVDCDGK